MRPDNLLYARRWDVKYHKEIELGNLYIIDFSESRQLGFGPGQQPPIDLPKSIIPKPLDMQRLDPYTFDVYCLGMVIDVTLTVCIFFKRVGPRSQLIPWFSGYTDSSQNRGFCSVMHSGSSGLSEDAPVCAIADQLLDGRVRSLHSCTGLCVVGLYGRASCTQSDMLSLCVSDLLSDYIMLHKYISQVSLVQCSLWQWAIRGVILLQKWYVLGLQYPLTARAPGYQTPLSGIPCFYITQTHVKRKRLTWMVLSQRILR